MGCFLSSGPVMNDASVVAVWKRSFLRRGRFKLWTEWHNSGTGMQSIDFGAGFKRVVQRLQLGEEETRFLFAER